MRTKLAVLFSAVLGAPLLLAGVAGATTTPVVDAEAEATALFNAHAPTVVAVVLAVAGFSITMAVLSAAIGRVRGALNGRR